MGARGLPPDLAARIAELGRGEPDLVAVWAYGSRVEGRDRSGSDLDLALLFRGVEPLEAHRRAEEWGRRLSLRLGIEIDARPLDMEDIFYAGHILRHGVRVYEGDPVARVRFEAKALSYFDEWAALVRPYRAAWRRRMAQEAHGPRPGHDG